MRAEFKRPIPLIDLLIDCQVRVQTDSFCAIANKNTNTLLHIQFNGKKKNHLKELICMQAAHHITSAMKWIPVSPYRLLPVAHGTYG